MIDTPKIIAEGSAGLMKKTFIFALSQSTVAKPTRSQLCLTVVCWGGGEDGSVMDPDTAQVREFIEKLVEGLLNGRLDNVYVNRLYNHPDCEYQFP
uniref:Uncharacterized protein n=1 Tax=Timema shepardi TaxID=629360 RepID=A0A7R9AUA0_TIMSH|nr:unnamed protein product [Timema shepardi]